MIQSVQRALSLLDFLTAAAVHGEGVALRDMAAHAGLASNTVHNLVKTLVDCGYASQDEDRRYRLGPRCGDLARGARLSGEARPRIEAAMHALARETGEAAVLALLLRGHRHVVLRLLSDEAVRVDPAIEQREMFFDVVTGRVLAAWASAEELEAILEAQGMPGEKWDGIGSRGALGGALEGVRAAGEALSATPGGVTSLAVPVLDRRGLLAGAVGLYLPTFRADGEKMALARRALDRAAKDLGPLLGSVWTTAGA